MGLDGRGLGSLAWSCSLSFMGAAVSHDIDYHDCLVSLAAVKVDHLMLSSTLGCHCTLTNNGASFLL
jgi:hypothetical protein